MFSTRVGFYGGRNWWDVANTEILSDIATWNRTAGYVTNNAVSLSGIYTVTQAFLGGTLHTNGNIYYPPFFSTSNAILCFNPTANTISSISTGLNITGSPKHYSGILAKNGKIYFPPINSGRMLILEPDNNNACSQQTWGLTLGNYDCSVYAHDYDKIYCIGSANHVLIVDLTANTAVQSNYGIITGSTSNRYVAGTYSLKSKKVIFAPYNTSNFFIIDPAANTAQTQTYGLTISQTQGCTNGKDGNVWATSAGGASTRTYTLDLTANTASIASTTAISSGAGAGMGSDGNIWIGAFPGGASGAFANVDTKVVQISPAFMTGTGVGQSRANYVMAFDGNVYAICQNINGSIIRSNPQGSGKTSTIVREIALSGYFNNR